MTDERFTDLNLLSLKAKYLSGDRSSRLARQTLGVLCVIFKCDPSFTELTRVYYYPGNYLKMVFDTTTKKEGVP